MITDEQTKKLAKNQVFQWAAIKAAVIEDGKILLGKRLDENDYGLYEIPGGKLEVGENFEEALKREVLEEAGVEIESLDVVPGNCKPVIVLRDRRKIVYLVVSAKVTSKKGMLKNTEELAEIDFYSKDEVRKMLDQKQTRPVYQTLFESFAKGELNV